MSRGNVKRLSVIPLLLLLLSVEDCNGKNDFRKVKNPCAVTKNIKSSLVIRVVDEVNDEQGVILGDKGLLYYTLIASRIQREVVIECSSSHSQVKWIYRGVGASSGFKIVNTRWSGSDLSRAPSCYSSAVVISHVTDQLTGEYRCQEVNSTRSKGPRRNSFKLFVPSTPPDYPKEGSEVNVTVSNDQEKHSKSLVVLPCISKRTSGEISLYRVDNETGEKELATYVNMKYDPFAGFKVPKISLPFENSTSRFLPHECRYTGSNSTLLKVNLVLESDEKIAPLKELVKSSSPYLSWTTKHNPKIQFTPDIESNALIWQQFYTKKGFEEISSDAPMFYLGSATLVNLTYGSEGQVSLYHAAKSPENGLIHKWEYLVLDAIDEQNAGLKYEEYEYFHLFICKSASEERPLISFKDVLEDGSTGSKNISGVYNITDCPKGREYGKVGCVILTSYVNQGEVRCVGDGVDETIRYPPPLPFEAGRPFFVERGSSLVVSLSPGTEKLRVPCLTNSEVSTSVFLYKMVADGYKKIWSEDDEEFGDSDIEFYPSSGFHLTQSSSGEMTDLEGEYLCSSSSDPNDMSDSVSVLVRKEIATSYKIHPAEERVFGRIPVKLSWEADEDLEVVSLSTPLRNISLGREESDEKYVFGGKTVIMEQTPEGEMRNVTLRRKSDGVVLHTWRFQQIDRDAEYRAGLLVEMKEVKGESFIVATCRSKTKAIPAIRYYHCLNDDACDLMRKCHEKDCYNPSFRHEEAVKPNIVDNCDSKDGCSSVVIRSMYVNGILNISCNGDGVKEYRVVKDVFFKEDIVWDTDDEDAYVYLSTAHTVHAADQNPEREVQYIGSNIEWEMGETVEFSCVAAPFLYSNGIKWAVETKNGKRIFQKDSVFDLQFKYTGSAQVASTFSLLIDRFDYARVYCFVPKLNSPHEWHNASTPIFIRSETSDDTCHEANSIHLINVYPTPSKLNLSMNETRLDKLPYFVVPDNVLQFAVKISGPKPFTWSFSGNGDGPTRTPLVQSDRQVLDFYDSSTYCYSSRLLINLRHKSPNDTGRYTVKHKYDSRELASFYMFVPSKNPPYLLRSGSTINITLPEDDGAFYIPCLVNNPDVKVALTRIDEMAETIANSTEMQYDPTRGFLMYKPDNLNSTTLMFKCTANDNQTDSVVVYASPYQRKPELKYEKVNDFHVFTCKSGNSTPPEMTLTEIADDGTPLNSTEHKTTRCSAGCVALITRVNQGSVSCVGEGIDETYRFPPTYNANKRNSDRSVGLWFDNTTNSFKCQMNSVESPSLAAVTCRRPNECEIMKRLLEGRGDGSQSTYTKCGEGCAELKVKVREMSYTAPNWFSIFLRCKGEDNMEILSQYFYDKDVMTYASLENAEKMKQIRIDVPALRRQGKMVFATFRCFANRYFYSRGIQWGLEGKNGILEFPATPASQIEVQHFSAVMSSINLEIDESIHTSVYCFVPLLDSAAWANSTLKFPIEQLQVNI